MSVKKHNLRNVAIGCAVIKSYHPTYAAWVKLVNLEYHDVADVALSTLERDILSGVIPILTSPNFSDESVENHCCGKVIETKIIDNCIYGLITPFGKKKNIFKDMLVTGDAVVFSKLVGTWERGSSIHRIENRKGLEVVKYIRLFN